MEQSYPQTDDIINFISTIEYAMITMSTKKVYFDTANKVALVLRKHRGNDKSCMYCYSAVMHPFKIPGISTHTACVRLRKKYLGFLIEHVRTL